MNKIIKATALALAMSATAIAPSFAQTNAPAARMKGMAGGGCPMMGMMGQGMKGRGMMGRVMTPGKQEQMGAMADRRLASLSESRIEDH